MATKKRAPAKPAYHHGDLRRALIASSIALIDAHGVEHLSLREVARAAGVSPAAPYHHFSTKAQLLGAIAASGFDALEARMRATLDRLAATDATTRLAALGTDYVSFALAEPTRFRLMFRPSLVSPADLPPECDPTGAFALLRATASEVTASLRSGIVDSDAMVLLAWSTVHGAAELALAGPVAEAAASPEVIGDIVVRALRGLLDAAAASPASGAKIAGRTTRHAKRA